MPFRCSKARTMLLCYVNLWVPKSGLPPSANRFDSAACSQLSVCLTLEIVDSPESHAHLRRDLLEREPFGQQAHEFVLPIRQRQATQVITSPAIGSRFVFSIFDRRSWDAECERG